MAIIQLGETIPRAHECVSSVVFVEVRVPSVSAIGCTAHLSSSNLRWNEYCGVVEPTTSLTDAYTRMSLNKKKYRRLGSRRQSFTSGPWRM